MDNSVDRHAISLVLFLAARPASNRQIRASTKIVYVPLPRSLRRSAEYSGDHGAALLRPQTFLHGSKRDTLERGLDSRLRRCIQVLNFSMPGNASVHGLQSKIANSQVSTRQFIFSLQFAHLDATAGCGSRKDFARQVAVDGDVSKKRLRPDGVI